MALVVTTRTYIGKGKFGVRNRTKGGGARYVGNTTSLSLKITSEKKTLKNRETAGGGNAAVLENIQDVTGEVVISDYEAENFAIGTRGGVVSEDDAAVNDEAHTAYTNCLVMLDHMPDMSATVTPVIAVSTARANSTPYLKGDCILASSVVYQCTEAGTSAGSAPTYSTGIGTTTTDGTVTWTSRGAVTMVDGTDYQLGKSAIQILRTASRFALGLPITVDYSQVAADWVHILTESQDEYELVFDGLNEVDGGNPCPALLYRGKFSPTEGHDMKPDDFAAMKLSFEVLPDLTISGTGLSQYGKFGFPA